MMKLFLPQAPDENTIALGREYRKRLIRVMRLKAGDTLQVFAPGRRCECRISSVQPEEVLLEIIRELPQPRRPDLHLILAQCIPKGDRFDWLIQKATELGIAEIIPLISERTVVKPAHVEGKIQRWNEISEQAAGQSENAFPALIHSPRSLDSFLQSDFSAHLKLLLHERLQSDSLKSIVRGHTGHSIIFIVGPEGGWTDLETERLAAADFRKVHLGPRILRSETAGLVLAALLQYELGDLS